MMSKALARKLTLGLSAVFAGVLAVAALTGCSGTNYGYTGGTAATVNGTEIPEDTITKYIQDFRTTSSLTSDDDWANWMKENSLTPETVRSQVIEYYVEIELKKQAAQEQGIEITEDQVNEQLNSLKSNYDSDDAWKKALASAGLTEDQYKESIETGLRDQALENAVAGDASTADDSAVLEMLNNYYTMFDGAKRSSHILFSASDQATAQTVLDQINAGTLSFEDAAKQYSTDTASAQNGGDVGWDATNSFVEAYTTALSNLSKGQVSGLVTSDYGIHIIKVTDEFHTSGNETSLSAYPQAFVDYITNVIKNQNQATAYSDWFSNYKSQADIQINDLPEKAPYNLDMTQYQDDSSDSSSDATNVTGNSETSTGTDGSSDSSSESSDSSDSSSK